MIVLRVPKRQLRIATGLALAAGLGGGVAAQATAPAKPVPGAQYLMVPSLPHEVSLDGPIRSVAGGTAVRESFAPVPDAPAMPFDAEEVGLPAVAPHDEAPQNEAPQGDQTPPPQGEQGPPPAAPQADAGSQQLLTDAERAALALVEQIIRDQEGVLMGSAFSYSDGGRRDPFMSLLLGSRGVEVPTVRPFGLPGFLISEVDLKAIATIQGRWHAMVTGPNQRAYFVEVGTELFDGHVKEIRSDEVIFEQVVPDMTGARRTREVTKRLTAGGGGEIPQ